MTTRHHWRGIRARVAGFREIRAARIDSGVNPAHCLANAPDQYAFVNDEPARCVLPSLTTESPGPQYPPPSRANRNTGNASD